MPKAGAARLTLKPQPSFLTVGGDTRKQDIRTGKLRIQRPRNAKPEVVVVLARFKFAARGGIEVARYVEP
jgi:hypothetical protein